MMILAFVLIAVISYLLGSLNFSVILSNRLKNDDVREHGSGNAGTTNMLRNYGKKYAVLTIIGDMLKVAVAILIAFAILKIMPISDSDKSQFDSLTAGIDTKMLVKSFAGLFCVLGHIFPCFFKFKGGKGVATSGGMVFVIDWRIALILLAIFAVVVLITKYVSLGSIVMALLYPVMIYIFHRSIVLTIIALVFTIIVVVAHRQNIYNLIHHKESKITDKKKTE
ncbi:MAG: glycerol-3-phosphate 1-O-acyltransferase PlsY [Eubacteriales bacterium]|nr:glycerol-3-phosphate 1-O-acyltransferase PlsY [Eubacteriales bacterium]